MCFTFCYLLIKEVIIASAKRIIAYLSKHNSLDVILLSRRDKIISRSNPIGAASEKGDLILWILWMSNCNCCDIPQFFSDANLVTLIINKCKLWIIFILIAIFIMLYLTYRVMSNEWAILLVSINTYGIRVFH